MKSLQQMILPALLLVAGMNVAADIPEGLTGTLIVLNKSGHDASFIDLGSGELLATLPTGRGPHELVVTSDGRWAIATDYSGSDSLTVFDVANLQVARTIDLSSYPRPHGILLMPGEQQVVVTSEASQNLVLVDFHSGTIVRTVSTEQPGSHMVALSGDGTTAFTSNGGGNSVSVIDLKGAGFQRAIPVSQGPEAITANAAGIFARGGSSDETVVMSPDDKTLFLSLSAQDKVAVIDTETRNLLGEYIAGDAPDGIGFSPLVLRRTD